MTAEVRRTAHFEPKTEESQRMIDLAPEALDVLRPFKKGSTSEFVLEGAQPNPAATYDYYRCDCLWRDLNAWLRGKGVRQQKAIHALRKESGSRNARPVLKSPVTKPRSPSNGTT